MWKKEITLGQAIAILLTISAAGFTWVISVSSRIEKNEVKTDRNTEDIRENEQYTQGKLDRIIELIMDKDK